MTHHTCVTYKYKILIIIFPQPKKKNFYRLLFIQIEIRPKHFQKLLKQPISNIKTITLETLSIPRVT